MSKLNKRTLKNRILLLGYFPVLAAAMASLIGMFYWLIQGKGIIGWPYLLSNQPAPHSLFMVTFFGLLTFGLITLLSKMNQEIKTEPEDST